MSLEKVVVCPTFEEIDLIRKKLNSIVDIPYEKGKTKNNLFFNEINNKNYLYPKGQNNNEIIEQLNQKIYELENTLSANTYKINNYDNLLNENKELNYLISKLKQSYTIDNNYNLSNYEINDDEDNINRRNPEQIFKNIKNITDTKRYSNNYDDMKYNNSNPNITKNTNMLNKESSYKNINKDESQTEIVNKLYNRNKYLNNEIDKLKRELYLSSKQNTSNKEILANYIQQILNEHKDELNTKLIKLLLDRIDKLEYQNYFLASKLENYIIIMNQFLEELCEYIDIIFDLGNVINDIPENVIEQNINEDFYLVRDTLNNKKDALNKKYEEYNNFKNTLNTDDALKNNDVFLMLGNKINDINSLINDDKISREYAKIIDEKIKKYENVTNNNNMKENKNLIDKELFITNHILEKQNSELRQIIKDIMANDRSGNPVINSEIKEKLINTLNNTSNYKDINITLYEDLIMMLNAQCCLNEMLINKNDV